MAHFGLALDLVATSDAEDWITATAVTVSEIIGHLDPLDTGGDRRREQGKV